MTYRAKMIDGKVVFEGGIKPAEGVELRVDVVASAPLPAPSDQAPTDDTLTIGQRMLKYAGSIPSEALPKDGSLQVDHYVYGTPKR